MKNNRIIVLLLTLNLALVGAFVMRELGEERPLFAPSARAAQLPPIASQRRTEIVEAAEHVSPAIVSVGASQTGYLMSPFMDFFSSFTVYPYTEKVPYLGSGVVIDPKGLIVTNHHVVENANDIFVTLMDGREYPATLVGADQVLDIALLKIDAKNLTAVKLGSSNGLLVGEWVLAMGNPFGNLIGDPTPTVTVGVVSALKRTFRPNSETSQRFYMDMIQTDAAINPGNSGGALINAAGELVGVNTFIMSRSGGAEGIGFAIPVDRVKQVVEEILMYGRIRSRLVDFRALNLSKSLARKIGTTVEEGAVISELAPAGPAKDAGLRIGDVVTKVNDRAVKTATDLMLYVYTQPVGANVELELDRSGKQIETEYKVTDSRD